MSKRAPVKSMFSLTPVEFRNSPIAGRGVFAKRRFQPGDVVVAYAPKQRRVDAHSAEAAEASTSKLTLLSGDHVIVPDTSVPGGWLCNHSCEPNAALFASGAGRIQCTRPIAPGDEVTIFYGWVSANEPERDPCHCGSPGCRGFINFDLSDDDVSRVTIRDGQPVLVDPVLTRKLNAYSEYLRSIGQEQVEEQIATMLVRRRLGKA
jgi:hypothetical protein